MSDFKSGDVVEVVETYPRRAGKGSIGKIYGTSASLVGLNFDEEGNKSVIVEFKHIKKISNSRLFPRKLKYIAP